MVAPTLPLHISHPKFKMFIKTGTVDALTLNCLLNLYYQCTPVNTVDTFHGSN